MQFFIAELRRRNVLRAAAFYAAAAWLLVNSPFVMAYKTDPRFAVLCRKLGIDPAAVVA